MHDASVGRNAEALELRVATAQRDLKGSDAPEGRAEALSEMLQYAALLREASVGTATRYSFKREMPNGNWDVAEQPLPAAPRVGDLVNFQDDFLWKVLRTQWVNPRPSGKPPRAVFVCAPAS